MLLKFSSRTRTWTPEGTKIVMAIVDQFKPSYRGQSPRCSQHYHCQPCRGIEQLRELCSQCPDVPRNETRISNHARPWWHRGANLHGSTHRRTSSLGRCIAKGSRGRGSGRHYQVSELAARGVDQVSAFPQMLTMIQQYSLMHSLSFLDDAETKCVACSSGGGLQSLVAVPVR